MTSSLGVQPNTGTVKNIWIFEARCACACVLFISIKNSKIPEHSARLIFGAGGGAQPGGLTLAVTTDRDCLGGVAAHPPTSANRPWRLGGDAAAARGHAGQVGPLEPRLRGARRPGRLRSSGAAKQALTSRGQQRMRGSDGNHGYCEGDEKAAAGRDAARQIAAGCDLGTR